MEVNSATPATTRPVKLTSGSTTVCRPAACLLEAAGALGMTWSRAGRGPWGLQGGCWHLHDRIQHHPTQNPNPKEPRGVPGAGSSYDSTEQRNWGASAFKVWLGRAKQPQGRGLSLQGPLSRAVCQGWGTLSPALWVSRAGMEGKGQGQ